MYSIAAALAASIRMAVAGVTPARVGVGDESSARALRVVGGLLRERPGGLAAVWGPPGTGKTTVYLKAFAEEMDRLEPGAMAAYVAPTNTLVVETLGRHVAAVLDRGFGAVGRRPTLREVEEALSMFKAYGSRVYPGTRRDVDLLVEVVDCGSLPRGECAERLSKALWSVVRGPPGRETRWIFSTEWQDVASRLRRALASPVSPTIGVSSVELGLFVDEASRSPLYRPFTTIAGLLEERLAGGGARGAPSILGRVDVYGLAVVGDDRQAISVHRFYHLHRNLLILRAVHGILERLGLCRGWEGDWCAALRVTRRIPDPSHEPISRAFYEGMLSAVEDAARRLKPLEPIAPRLRRAARRLPEAAARAVEAVAEAIESGAPVVVVETKAFPKGDTFEPRRAAIARAVADAIAEALEAEGLKGFDVAVSSVYGELADSARHGLRRRAGVRVRASTVHSLLGGEADVHVTMLGKEWMPRAPPYLAAGEDEYDYATIYYREPELLNVQLSRHKRLLVVVGSLQTLAREARRAAKELAGKPRLAELAKATEQMAEAARALRALARDHNTLVTV